MIKLSIALAIGLIIGFERQWSNKDFGVRTFSFAALLGALRRSSQHRWCLSVWEASSR
ncbi:MgtC/SapB family protein [Acidobacterium sp. S8]|uniref:MgtC/SapB family protein n=1 Tax=Acidobacterium sp. S8 TaxID=1641854 RepID=UPI00131DD5BD